MYLEGTFLFASNQRKSTSGALVISVVFMSVSLSNSKKKGCGFSWGIWGVQEYLFQSNLFTTCTLAPFSSFYFFNLLKYRELEKKKL